MEENKEPILIIDFDISAFTVCRTTEDISPWGESFSEADTIRLFDLELESISKKTGYAVKDIYCAVSSDKNFRKIMFPTYKSNRKDVKKPLGLPFLRQHLFDNSSRYNTTMLESLEAD